jgi:gluconolactonase
MELIARTAAHEGPVVIGDELYFTTLPHVPGRTSIRRLSLRDGSLCTVVADANGANGMTRDAEGRLIVCEQGTLGSPAAVTRIDPRTGQRVVLTDGCDGLPFNSPNDVCVRSDASVWFTDPSYGFLQGFRPPPADGDHVYRFDPATGVTARVASGFDKPNGLTFSPDERTLYVGDNGAGALYAIDVATGERRRLATFEGEHPDGLKAAPDGRLHASSVHGIDVLDPDGAPAGRIDVPGAVNLWIEGDRVYITADTAIWAAERSTT